MCSCTSVRRGDSLSYVGIIAAGGAGNRTGLSKYTSKAALSVRGKSLLEYNVDFLKRSGVDRVYVVCPTAHVKLLASILPDVDRKFVSFVILPVDGSLGWAGTVEHAAQFFDADDEVLLISCDNYHTVAKAERLLEDENDVFFTFTERVIGSANPSNGPVFGLGPIDGQEIPGWMQRSPDFVGSVFTGYVVVRGRVLLSALAGLSASYRGEKEITKLLELFRCRSIFYTGTYEDVADLVALARLDTRLRGDLIKTDEVQIGAGVLLHNRDGKVFLTERQDGLGWVMPGGLVDAGESYSHAAVRELREEVGVEIAEEDLRLLGVYPTIGKHGGPSCSVIFHNKVEMRVLHVVDSHEVKDVGWFDAEEVNKLEIPFNLRAAVDDQFAGHELDCR